MPTRSPYKMVLESVKDTIESLSLTGITRSRILIRKTARDVGLTHPTILLIPLAETIEPGTNQRYDVTYNVNVIATQVSNRSDTLNDDRLMLWRGKIIDAFIHKRILPSCVHLVTIEPGPVFDPTSFDAQYDATSLILRCPVRHTVANDLA